MAVNSATMRAVYQDMPEGAIPYSGTRGWPDDAFVSWNMVYGGGDGYHYLGTRNGWWVKRGSNDVPQDDSGLPQAANFRSIGASGYGPIIGNSTATGDSAWVHGLHYAYNSKTWFWLRADAPQWAIDEYAQNNPAPVTNDTTALVTTNNNGGGTQMTTNNAPVMAMPDMSGMMSGIMNMMMGMMGMQMSMGMMTSMMQSMQGLMGSVGSGGGMFSGGGSQNNMGMIGLLLDRQSKATELAALDDLTFSSTVTDDEAAALVTVIKNAVTTERQNDLVGALVGTPNAQNNNLVLAMLIGGI